MRLAFVVPEQSAPSGGATYNAAIVEALRAGGVTVDLVGVPGGWPDAEASDRTRLTEVLTALHPRSSVVVDGLVGSACPDELRDAVATGHDIALLVHLPLPAEAGLTRDDAERLASLERAAVRTASVVLVTSRWAGADLRERYGVTPRAVLPGAAVGPVAAGSDPPHLLVLGALTPRKNHLTVLRALRELTDLSWRLDLVGPDGSASEEMGADLAASGLGDRVTLHGALTGDALEARWAATDLLLLPSLVETFGLVVTEALARGIPSVVAAGTGAVEALTGRDATVPRSDLGPAVARTDRGAAERESGSEPSAVVGVASSDRCQAAPVALGASSVDVDGDRQTPGTALPPLDVDAWADTLRRWLTDAHLRHRWRGAARSRRSRLRPWSDAASDLVTALGR